MLSQQRSASHRYSCYKTPQGTQESEIKNRVLDREKIYMQTAGTYTDEVSLAS